MTPLEAAWQSVLSTPDDDHALQVLADALMEQGDPHGELIRMQLSGDEAGAKSFIASHCADLLGEHHHLDTWSPLFARGFLSTVRVETVRDLRLVLARPVSRLLREVRISAAAVAGQVGEEDALGPIEELVEVLAVHGPRTISTLRFSSASGAPTHPGQLEVSRLTARFRSLEELQLSACSATFEGASSASLRRLHINLQNPVSHLDEARLTALESLSLDLPFRRLDFPLPLLAGEVAPKLSSLRISGALWPQQLSDLAVSALLRGLKRLDIAAEAETGWYTTLLETIDSFAHLEHLELTADRHHPEWVEAVKAALPQVTIRAPRLRL